MKKAVLLFMVLVFMGAGCGTQPITPEGPVSPSKETNKQKTSSPIVPAQEEPRKGLQDPSEATISLELEEKNGKEYTFSWVNNDGAVYDTAEYAYMLIRAEEKNPEHSDQNYWYRARANQDLLVVDDLDTGIYYFRVCIFLGLEYDTGRCLAYSNDVQVIVE